MRLLLALLLLPAPAFAQASPPGLDPVFMQHAIVALRAQREAAMDDAAARQAQLTQSQAQAADLQKQLTATQKELAESKASLKKSESKIESNTAGVKVVPTAPHMQGLPKNK